jgi:pentatricopeptide repeat protein
MVDNGVRPDTVTYNSLIHGYSTSGQSEEVARLLEEMKTQGIMWDIFTCNSFMDYLWKTRRIKEAVELFYSMVEKGHKPDVVSYAIMLHGYATEGSLVDMNDFREQMVRDGVVPSLSVYNILIGAYAKCGKMDAAMLVFEDMLKHGVNPDQVTYLIVIAAFCRMGRMDDAMDKFSEMIDMGVPHDTDVYECMIKGYFRQGDLVKANELFTEMKNKDIRRRPQKGSGRTHYV